MAIDLRLLISELVVTLLGSSGASDAVRIGRVDTVAVCVEMDHIIAVARMRLNQLKPITGVALDVFSSVTVDNSAAH